MTGLGHHCARPRPRWVRSRQRWAASPAHLPGVRRTAPWSLRHPWWATRRRWAKVQRRPWSAFGPDPFRPSAGMTRNRCWTIDRPAAGPRMADSCKVAGSGGFYERGQTGPSRTDGPLAGRGDTAARRELVGRMGSGRAGARPAMQGGIRGGLRHPRATPSTPPLHACLSPAARPRVRRGRGPGDVHRRVPADGALRAPPVAGRLAEHDHAADRHPRRRAPACPAEDVDRRAGLQRRRPCGPRATARRRPWGIGGPRRHEPRRRPPGVGRGRRAPSRRFGGHRGAAVQVPGRGRASTRDGPRLRGGRPRARRAPQHLQEPSPPRDEAPARGAGDRARGPRQRRRARTGGSRASSARPSMWARPARSDPPRSGSPAADAIRAPAAPCVPRPEMQLSGPASAVIHRM